MQVRPGIVQTPTLARIIFCTENEQAEMARATSECDLDQSVLFHAQAGQGFFE
jgi:hypothetical protein